MLLPISSSETQESTNEPADKKGNEPHSSIPRSNSIFAWKIIKFVSGNRAAFHERRCDPFLNFPHEIFLFFLHSALLIQLRAVLTGIKLPSQIKFNFEGFVSPPLFGISYQQSKLKNHDSYAECIFFTKEWKLIIVASVFLSLSARYKPKLL